MKKLIYNSFLLALSVILCITVSYTWYTNNKVATAETVAVQSMDFECTTNLYRYNKTLSTYTLYNNPLVALDFGDLSIGEVEYLKLEITFTGTDSVTADFGYGPYSSSVSSELTVLGSNVYTVDLAGNNLNLYTLNGSNQVIVDGQVLYNYEDPNLSLDYYKIENAIRTYYLDEITSDIQVPTIGSNTPTLMSENIISNFELVSGVTKTIYFAIEFNEAATIVPNYYSNCFAYQELLISYLKINMVI